MITCYNLTSMKQKGILQVKGLEYEVDNQKIIKGLSFNINNKEHKLILGNSGSGKTTLLNLCQVY